LLVATFCYSFFSYMGKPVCKNVVLELIRTRYRFKRNRNNKIMKNESTILSKRSKKPDRDYNLIKILIVLFLPYLALSLAQTGFLGLLPFVREEFTLTRVQVGYYSTFFFISAASLSIFTGSIVDKLGPKKSMLLGIGCLGFLLLLHGLSPSYSLLLLLSFLTGLGFSIITPSATKAVMIATPREKRAFSMGITQVGFGLGGILGASFLPLLGESMGWRRAIQIAAVIVLFAGFFIYKLYQEQKDINHIIHTPEDKRDKQKSFFKNLSSIIIEKPLFSICILGILFGISEGSLLGHFVVFLTGDLKISKVTAGLHFATLHMGGMLGLLGWGSLSDRFFRIDRRFSLFLIGLSTGIMYLIFGLFLCHPFLNQIIVFIFSFLFGFVALGWAGVYLTTVGEVAGDRKAGIATGLALLFIRTGMILAPPIFGLIADRYGYYRNSWLIFSILIMIISFLFLKKK